MGKKDSYKEQQAAAQGEKMNVGERERERDVYVLPPRLLRYVKMSA